MEAESTPEMPVSLNDAHSTVTSKYPPCIPPYPMMPQQAYDPLPRTSLSIDDTSADELKDKPLPRHGGRTSSLLRKTRRYASRFCRPFYVAILVTLLLSWQLLFNASYTSSSAPAYTISPTDTVYIAANIIDGSLIEGAWGASLIELVNLIGPERVFVSIYGGPTDALRWLEQKLPCDSAVVSELEDPLDMGAIPRTNLPTGESRIKRIAYLAEVRNKVLQPLYNPPAKSVEQKRKYDKVLFINDVFFDAEGATRLLWGTNADAEGKSAYKAVCAADFVASWKYYDTFATRDVEGYSIGVPLFPWFAAEGDAITRNDVLAGKDAVRVKSCWGGMVAFDGRYFSSGEDKKTTKPHNGLGVPTLPLSFRSEPEPFWDSSECCLIHADIMSLPSFPTSPETKHQHKTEEIDKWDTGIYMNPYVRTSYSAATHRHIWLAKRFERLFSPVQRALNYFAKMPRWNYRRGEKEGEVLGDKLWVSVHSNLTVEESIYAAEHDFSTGVGVSDPGAVEKGKAIQKREKLGTVKGKEYWSAEGYYMPFNRTAKRGGYCGVRQLLVVKEGKLREGEGNWDDLLDQVPPWEA